MLQPKDEHIKEMAVLIFSFAEHILINFETLELSQRCLDRALYLIFSV